ncbi:MAG: hypothetical protein SFY56_06260 [Bacteroidota bacterium]|nr:hypothetical protein [Bacteroidota bacterium]
MNPLLKKLNFKNQKQLLVLNAPNDLTEIINEFKNEVEIVNDIKAVKSLEFVLIFVTTFKDLEKFTKQIHKNLSESCLLWYCYPKQSSKKHKSEINRDTGWKPIGDLNYEPVRLVAINEDWSGLRFKPVAEIKIMNRHFSISKAGKERIGK